MTDTALNRLLTGRSAVDFIGRSRLWLQITVALVALCLGALTLRGLNFGIEFTGGSAFTVTDAQRAFTADEISEALAELGIQGAIVQVVSDG